MSYRALYIILGCLFVCFTGLGVALFIATNNFIPGYTFAPATMAIIAFCGSYLYPQMKQNDERSKFIRQKGMFYAFFMILIFLAVLAWLVQFNILVMTVKQIIPLVLFLVIGTVFISMVIAAKRN